MQSFREDNVKLVGPYGYMLRPDQQFERRTYTLDSGELVNVRCQRLTPKRSEELKRLDLPSGKYLLTRRLLVFSNETVLVEISKHD